MVAKGKGGPTPYNMGWSVEDIEEWEHCCFDFLDDEVNK